MAPVADSAPLTAVPNVALPGDEVVISGTRVQSGAEVLLWGDPDIVGSLNLPGYSWDIAIAGDYAYIASGNAGLHVVNIADPRNPSLVATVPLTGDAVGLTLTSSHVLIATESGGMQIVDVSNPQSPILLSEYSQPSITSGISETNSYAYTANYVQKVAAAVGSDLESLVLLVRLHDRALGRSGTNLFIAQGAGPLTLDEITSGMLEVPAFTYSIENDFGQIGGSPLFPGGTQDGPIIVGRRDDLKPILNLNNSAAIISAWVANINTPAAGGIVSVGRNGVESTNRGGVTIGAHETGNVYFLIARWRSPNGPNCTSATWWGSARPITDGKRHHIVVVYDPVRDEMYTYIDGIKGSIQALDGCRADTEGDDAGTSDGANKAWFSLGETGGLGANGRKFFNGTIEELYILKPATIPPEIDVVIREWYTLGSPGPIGAGLL